MSIIARPTPSGHVTFCDDIRFEQFGKISLVGIYLTEIVLHADPPANMAKLGIAIQYTERPNESREPVQIRIILSDNNGNEEVVSQFDLQVEEMRMTTVPLDMAVDGYEPFITTFIPAIIAPFAITKFGRLFVKAFRGDDEVRLGSVLIRRANPDDPPISPSASRPPSSQSPPGAPAS